MIMRSFVCVACVVAWGNIAMATPLALVHDLAGPGLQVAHGGIGLQGLGSNSRSFPVTIGGPVELALLYWTGRDRPCSLDPDTGVCEVGEEPYRDQILLLDNAPVLGTVTGTEFQPDTSRGMILNIGYVADVTEAVRARGTGQQSFSIADGDRRSNLADLNGAGLLVVYTAPSKPAARVLIFQGLDFAYGEDRTPGATRITEAITFPHEAARSARTGGLVMFVGDASPGGPDRIDIGLEPSISEAIDGSAGGRWDADRFPVRIREGSLATTVRLASEPWGRNPDSLLWVMASLTLPLPVPTGCSTAYWHADDDQWKLSGLPLSQRVKFVFPAASRYALVGEATLRTALRFQDTGGLLGAAKSLVREGSAAVLNGAHPKLEYLLTRTQAITRINDTLRSGDEAAIRALSDELKEANGAKCPLPG